MSNFKFKGVPLSDVINTTTGATATATGYGFNYKTTAYNNSKPLTTYYKINNVDLANTAEAKISTITATGAVTVPTGVTEIRYMMCGGGGAGGSGGGERFSDAGTNSQSPGGAGGAGGRGKCVYGTANTFDSIITIEVGAGGPAQTTVGNATNGDNNNEGEARQPGHKGPDGSPTKIIFTASTIVNASGGGGGNGGDPGSTNSPDAGVQPAGAAGNANTTYTTTAGWDNTTLNDSGLSGSGGHGGGNAPGGAGGAGNAGSPGVVQLIWLYG